MRKLCIWIHRPSVGRGDTHSILFAITLIISCLSFHSVFRASALGSRDRETLKSQTLVGVETDEATLSRKTKLSRDAIKSSLTLDRFLSICRSCCLRAFLHREFIIRDLVTALHYQLLYPFALSTPGTERIRLIPSDVCQLSGYSACR